MPPTHSRIDDLHRIGPEPPIGWIRGSDELIVSDTFLFDLAHLSALSALGAVPAGPAPSTAPPSPCSPGPATHSIATPPPAARPRNRRSPPPS
ncbi:hypothetical protein ACIO6T_40830 [Streptomyces sp. NPDC087532]|uniref:hypothetical protein n=1 Tax=unclassified Streptomyces TaxID=2593676 RepID=UPI0034456894